MDVGDIWRWTRNSSEHPNDPDHNYFLVLDMNWGIKVLYLASGQQTVYTADTFTVNKEFLEMVA